MKSKKEKIMSKTIFLSLGSNLGDRERNLVKACENLTTMEGFELIASSPIYITQPVKMEPSTPTFLNMIIKGQFNFTPLELLQNIENIENEMGRESKGDKKPRSIDIDILLFGDEKIKSAQLTIPHPRMTQRAFVLVPLLQIEPDITHPANGKRFDTFLKKEEADSLILYKESVRNHV
jgi:2-amino-4-hydroxy-6-hydroxymethyldihydropteridine diphosphokinase